MNRRPGWRSSGSRVFAALAVFAALGVVPHRADDSLRSALEAISDKISESPSPRVVYLSPDDGQPEDIGYGYQKNLRNLENVYDPGAGAPFAGKTSKDEMVVKFLDYLSRDGQPGSRPSRQRDAVPNQWSKKSIFRERVDSDVPDGLQQLQKTYDRYAAAPSAFRERYAADPVAVAELARDYKTGADDRDDDYLYSVNSLLDKYIAENVQGMSDEELEELLGSREDKRDVPDDAGDDGDDDEYQQLLRSLQYYEPGYKRVAGRRPAKRQFLFVPMFPRYQHSRKNGAHHNRWTTKPRLIKRSKKNALTPATNGTTAMTTARTDPKVAAELNSIFLGSPEPDGANATGNDDARNRTSSSAPPASGGGGGGGTDYDKIEVTKKSIDWSNYFGYDRKKKSIDSVPSDDTILNQYMRTYGKEYEDNNEANTINNLKNDRLMWLEDELIDDALKYTGANHGTDDPEEINNVKNRVLTNLNQAYNIEKLMQDKTRQGNSEMLEKPYDEKSAFVLPAENNSQPMNSLDTAEPQKEADRKECSQLLQITQDCLDLGGSAGDLMLPVCTLYRVCRTCESEQSECEQRFVQGSHELCSRAPLCRYFSRRMLQLMQDRPLQMECHKCMINFLQNGDE